MRLNDIPVEEREETALDRVDALHDAQVRFKHRLIFHNLDLNILTFKVLTHQEQISKANNRLLL